MKNHDPKFEKKGIGLILADHLNKYIQENREYFPFGIRPVGNLMVLSDYGGQHKSSKFETFSFLIFDLEANQLWLTEQQKFRKKYMTDGRRMSFKSMNDSFRRRSLVPFLTLADLIDGWLVTFSISKNLDGLFDRETHGENFSEDFHLWKSRPREKLLSILHLSGFLVSGLSVPNQNVFWICDHDDIAANLAQLTQLTNLFGRICANFGGHPLGHLRCGTAQVDDGSLAVEDLLSICDLSAGLVAEMVSGMVVENIFPRKGLFTGMPNSLSPKSNVLASWLSHDKATLRRITCVIDEVDNGFPRATTIKTHVLPKPDLYPSILRLR